jgi:branched-chain amino acid transport system permease protein
VRANHGSFGLYFAGGRVAGRLHRSIKQTEFPCRRCKILIDGFAISSLYALGAIGFTLIFGVSGVLNLSHGAIMVVAALIGWSAAGEFGLGPYLGALAGVGAALALAYLTYFAVVRPIQRSRAISREETEIFVLTGTLLWGLMIQVGMGYLFSDNPVTMRPLVSGVIDVFGVRTPSTNSSSP